MPSNNDLQLANLTSLRQRWYLETGAVGAADLVLHPKGRPKQLSRLLRDHNSETVDDLAEIHLRDLFDALFSYFSLLEIGLAAESLPNPLPAPILEECQGVLNHAACIRYYEVHYPLRLPVQLRERLRGTLTPLPDSTASDIRTAHFLELLSFDLDFRSDTALRTILRLLDYFTVKGIDLDHLTKVFREPEKVAAALLADPQQDPYARPTSGFLHLLSKFQRLEQLLDRKSASPLLQSLTLDFYRYWIERAANAEGLLNAVETLAKADEDGEELLAATQSFRRLARRLH
jgi:hypothetical protein